MPDHVPIVATGRTQESDLRKLVMRWKQSTGFAWSQLGHGRLWQEGYWDRLARFDEPVADMVRYVVENPVRAHLVTDRSLYPLAGSIEIELAALAALKCRPSGTAHGSPFWHRQTFRSAAA